MKTFLLFLCIIPSLLIAMEDVVNNDLKYCEQTPCTKEIALKEIFDYNIFRHQKVRAVSKFSDESSEFASIVSTVNRGNSLVIWDKEQKDPVREFKLKVKHISYMTKFCLTATSDKKVFISGSYKEYFNKYKKKWPSLYCINGETGDTLFYLNLGLYHISQLTYNPDTHTLVSAHKHTGSTIFTFDKESNEPLTMESTPYCYSASWDSNNETLISGPLLEQEQNSKGEIERTTDNGIYQHSNNFKESKKMHELCASELPSIHMEVSKYNAVAFCTRPKAHFINSLGTYKSTNDVFYCQSNPKKLKIFSTGGISCSATALKFDPTGKLLAIADSSGKLDIWDVDQEKIVGRFCTHEPHIKRLEWIDNGRTIIAATRDDLKRYDVSKISL